MDLVIFTSEKMVLFSIQPSAKLRKKKNGVRLTSECLIYSCYFKAPATNESEVQDVQEPTDPCESMMLKLVSLNYNVHAVY